MEFSTFIEAADGKSKGEQYRMLYNCLMVEVRTMAVIFGKHGQKADADVMWRFVERAQALVHWIETQHGGIDHVFKVLLWDGSSMRELPFLFSDNDSAWHALGELGSEGWVVRMELI